MRSATLALAMTLSFSLTAADTPRIGLAPGAKGEPAAVEASGLPKETLARLKDLDAKRWPEVLRVVVAGGTAEEVRSRLPVAGSYSLTSDGIRFTPQFPLLTGRDYRVILHPEYDSRKPGPAIETTLSIPKLPPGPRVAITAVYPSGSRLPENTLRFYIHFSSPVARGDVYRHLKLVRDDGVEVKSPFLELDEELWSPDGKRLTVLFHPGRVKRELVPREEEGPVLEAGRTYTLSISDRWEDVDGRPIRAGFRKTFTAGPADDRAIDLAEWTLIPPRAGSDSPLVVRLPGPLDHALLGRMVWVADESGARVPGIFTVGGGERVLTFTPNAPWARGEYRLATDPRLEDVCGNRVGEPFEMEVEKQAPQAAVNLQPTERSFMVR